MKKHSAAARSALKIDHVDLVVDLRSVSRLRGIANDPVFDLVKAAVDVNFVSVSGLDLENYRVGSFGIVASTFPPAFAEAYSDERLFEADPLPEKHRTSS